MIIQSTLQEVLLFLIEQTNKMAKQYASARFSEKGIDVTVDQWVLLKFIHENPGLSQIAIARHTFKDAASIVRMIDLLCKKDLVERVSLPDNRRQFSVRLTRQGQRFIKKHLPFVQELRNQSTNGLTEKEMEHLKSTLIKMQKNFE